MEAQGWIKLHRKLVDWQWYRDVPTCHLFMHLLLICNHKPQKWLSHIIETGQRATSYPKLALETGLSVQQVRTALNKLKSTGVLTVKNHSKLSIVTITNYEQYQVDNRQSNIQSTGNQQADNRQSTTNNNDKKENKEKNERESSLKLFEYCLGFLTEEEQREFNKRPEEGIPDQLSQEWINRKGNTEGVWKVWSKFFNYYLNHEPRSDWKEMWINWVINERTYAEKKKWG